MDLHLDRKDAVIKIERLESLYDVSGVISSKVSLKDILAATPVAIEAITGSDKMHIAIVKETVDGFELDRDFRTYTCPFPHHLMRKDERARVAMIVIKTNKPIMVLSSGRLIAYDELDEGCAGDILFTVVPLSVRDRSIGFLSVVAPENRRFNHTDIVLLTVIANQIAIAVENVRLRERMQKLILSEERHRIAEQVLAVIMKEYSRAEPGTSPRSMGIREELTPKERQVLTLMARGYTNEQIAKDLWVGLKTVKTHVSSIIRKLGQKNRVQAVICALKSGLIEFTPE